MEIEIINKPMLCWDGNDDAKEFHVLAKVLNVKFPYKVIANENTNLESKDSGYFTEFENAKPLPGEKLKSDHKVFSSFNNLQPDYYKAGKLDVIDFCEHHKLGFSDGTIIKYVTRAGKKTNNSRLQDLQKAQVFLERLIEYEKQKE